MNSQERLAEPEDFEGFYAAAFPAHVGDQALKGIVQREWLAVLLGETSISLVVEDRSCSPARIVGCAQGAFLQSALAQKLRLGTTPWVNSHLAASLPGHPSPMLSHRELAHANTQGTLSGVMARWHIALHLLDGDQAMTVRDTLHRGFEQFSRGHHFREILVETTGTAARDEALASGFHLLNDYSSYFETHPPLPPEQARPFLLAVTREQALAQRNSLISYAFAYKPPRFFFSHKEREVLQHAVGGAKNDELAERCALSLNGLKSRWRMIFDRVQAIDPALLPGHQGSTRGEEKRAELLKYLDRHPEELRPHQVPSGFPNA